MGARVLRREVLHLCARGDRVGEMPHGRQSQTKPGSCRSRTASADAIRSPLLLSRVQAADSAARMALPPWTRTSRPQPRRTIAPQRSRSYARPIRPQSGLCSGTRRATPAASAMAGRLPRRCSTVVPATARSASPASQIRAACKHESDSVAAVDQTAAVGAKERPQPPGGRLPDRD
jgi:hypothetical protein